MTTADHLVSAVPVLAISCHAVEASDELFGGLSLPLCSPVEPWSLEDNVFSDSKKFSALGNVYKSPSAYRALSHVLTVSLYLFLLKPQV